jgi:hypothetical protein
MAQLLFPSIVALSLLHETHDVGVTHEYAYKPGIVTFGGRPKSQDIRYDRIPNQHTKPNFMTKLPNKTKNYLQQPRSHKTGFQKKWQRK